MSFYRESLAHSIFLSDNYLGPNFRKSFICNWIDKTERDYDHLLDNAICNNEL